MLKKIIIEDSFWVTRGDPYEPTGVCGCNKGDLSDIFEEEFGCFAHYEKPADNKLVKLKVTIEKIEND